MNKGYTRALVLLVFLATTFSACKDYLDIKPYGRTVPKSAEEFSALLHNHLNDLDVGNTNYLVGTATLWNEWDGAFGDDFEPSLTGVAGRSLRTYVGDVLGSTAAYTPWQLNYEVIRDCNICLDGVEDRDSEMGRKVLATAHALRAVAYWQLMRLYCEAPVAGQTEQQLGLPLIKTFDMNAKVGRSSLAATIAFIEQDLKAAIALDNKDAIYRFTPEVCWGYLARLYHWAEQWQQALDASNKVLATRPLVEGEAYRAMFEGKGELSGSQLLKSYRVITGTQTFTNALSFIQARPVSARLISLFPENERAKDSRYQQWFNSKRQVQKYYFCGMRSAEMALIAAEAECHIGQETAALARLNALRRLRIADYTELTSATLPAVSTTELIRKDATGKDLSPLLATILRERRKELFMEGDRFFELKRCGAPSFTSIYNARAYTTESYMYTFPIPPSDVQLSSLEQNPGYTDFITE